MDRRVPLVLATGILYLLPIMGQAQVEKMPGTKAALESDISSRGDSALPRVPAGTSTIFGGAIRKVDPVLDQIQLNVYGERPMKVQFDERTLVFRDGVKIPLQDLKPADHASVQTTLDGEKVFAISIHILSQPPQGQYRGRVLNFNRSTGELSLDAAPSRNPFTVHVPAAARVTRTGQSTFTSAGSGFDDLRPGSLLDVTFGAEGGKEGVASQIVVLAVQGSSFIFSGDIVDLDLGTGVLTLEDPRDQKDYRVAFEPRTILNDQELHVGQHVRITASYEGDSYTASNITPD